MASVVTTPNLGRGFDIGVNTPGSIEVDIGPGLSFSGNQIVTSAIPNMPPLAPAPTIAYSSGVGSGANLINVVTTLVDQSPYGLSYMITADWTFGTGAQTVLQINNIPAGKAHSISFGMVRNTDNRTQGEISIRGQSTLIFRNTVSGAGPGNPMKITVFVSVAP